MPKRTDIKKILVIGSGSIVIGQGCEFDYSGTQGIKALREDGYEVVLINSNPATIMTDPELADRTYIEPLTPEFLEEVLKRERPQAILPTLGGQTALNLTVAAAERGIIEKYGVELLGARLETIRKAEDRQLFKQCMQQIGLDLPKSLVVTDVSEAKQAARELGFPLIVRASFTLGGTGGGIAYHLDDLRQKVHAALEASPVKKVLLEESALGWKEFELEVMRDAKDNFVVVCSIENIDPMGVHTGDSLTVAPAMTLTDRQYQQMRDEAKKVVSAIGVETGGCNIQFAVHPRTGRRVVVEINPRVSRSSALASKATGFPIAKIAAKLAVGYTLDEIRNDITKATPACFEPSIDYVVVKAPRFAFEKFGDFPLDTAMKSVGEVMAIGRTFKESIQKALRGLEGGKAGFDFEGEADAETLLKKLSLPSSGRVYWIKAALRSGMSAEDVAETTQIDPWFIHQFKELVDFEAVLSASRPSRELLRQAKGLGFSDVQLARLWKRTPQAMRALRRRHGLRPAFKLVDTCAGEFRSATPYFYSTYEDESDAPPGKSRKKVVILGSGPNRIGQGIEFDYCCVQSALALRALGCESIMVNCNPETVSTDYDTSDRLYFEPLTFENVMDIVERERPLGVIVQFGGQTPLNLAAALEKAGVPILGTQVRSIDIAEDRRRFGAALRELGIPAPENGIARDLRRALALARSIGYPVMARPSYVLGGRNMQIIYDDSGLRDYMERQRASRGRAERHPSLLIDRFLADATEVDVDAVCDGKDVFIAGVMEHIEEAGIHSGDSACTLPPHSLGQAALETIRRHTTALALKLEVRGLINIQFAVKDGAVYILEANPRASRTVPFVSKATGIPVARLATSVMLGKSLSRLLPRKLLAESPIAPPYTATKEAVLPFIKFPGIDPRLGPEMKSTGEVMGIDVDFPRSFAKSQEASGLTLPASGSVFISVRDADKPEVLHVARSLRQMGFSLVATRNTREFLGRHGIEAERVAKLGEGKPDVVDLIKQRSVSLVINTPSTQRSRSDGYAIRRTALELNVPCITNIHSCQAAVHAIAAAREARLTVKPLQEYYRQLPYRFPAET
ncbi:MAG: carbamoyl-phosphate synthase large subunit [Elusimicrobia bacterium]|nr:carbamoyl-phosphate synthase large subunit [Elusimicrobiota bacterium]MDE2425182.1 carbamoyl-phosphate synthase large subunit [Elusimicrobiota bacterium]